MENLELFYLDIWPILATLANTLITMLILKKLLFKTVMGVIQKRKDEVDSTYETAENARAEALRMKEEYTTRISNAKEEAAEILQSATKKANDKGEEIVREAQLKATGIIQKAETEIEQDKKRAVNEIKNEISSIAIIAASKIIEKEITAKDHQRFIDEFINEAGD